MKYEFKGFLYYVRLIKKLNENMLAEAARQSGLSIQEADVLLFLKSNPEFDTARDVALYREVSRAYVSKAVEMLVKKKFLNILHDKDDRRVQHLAITDKAASIAESLHKAQYDFYDAITAGFTEQEFKHLFTILHKCADNVQALSNKKDAEIKFEQNNK